MNHELAIGNDPGEDLDNFLTLNQKLFSVEDETLEAWEKVFLGKIHKIISIDGVKSQYIFNFEINGVRVRAKVALLREFYQNSK